MIDKELVKKRFAKSLTTYEDNAFVQKEMGLKLINLLGKKDFNSIFEVGCASGLLTKQIKENLIYETLTANDIVPQAQDYVKDIATDFICADIETINLNKNYDLIISNACLQWCNDINATINNLLNALNNNGILAFSLFGEDNLKEIKNLFNFQNKIQITAKVFKEENIKLYFDSPIDVLKHLKLTGVNALKEHKFTKSSLKEFEKKYKELYSENGKVYLTYNPIYLIIKKNDTV